MRVMMALLCAVIVSALLPASAAAEMAVVRVDTTEPARDFGAFRFQRASAMIDSTDSIRLEIYIVKPTEADTLGWLEWSFGYLGDSTAVHNYVIHRRKLDGVNHELLADSLMTGESHELLADSSRTAKPPRWLAATMSPIELRDIEEQYFQAYADNVIDDTDSYSISVRAGRLDSAVSGRLDTLIEHILNAQ